MTIWLLQLPRLDDTFSWGLKEVQNILHDLHQPVEVIDINAEITKKFIKTTNWDSIEDYGIKGKSNLPIDEIKKLITECISKIQPQDIVLSCVFTVESRSWFRLVHAILRKKFGDKILLGAGGQGIKEPGDRFDKSEWADWTLALGLANVIFVGETVKTIPDWVESNFTLKGKVYHQHQTFPNLGFLKPKLLMEDFDRTKEVGNYATPSHRDEKYFRDGGVKIHFTHGCVKQCTFCDVWHTWPQFVMKDPHDVIKEIDYYNKNMKVTHISFPDNTINASNSQFIRMLELFYDWKDKNNRHDITWSSQFAIKPSNQFSDEMFHLIADTGGELSIGFDHASDDVLQHMKKLYKWNDIESFIIRSNHYKINITNAIWMVGYPTETRKDYDQYEKLIDLIQQENTILAHNVQVTTINRASPLEKIVNIDFGKPNDWHNDFIDKSVRIDRKNKLDHSLQKHKADLWQYKTTMVRTQS